MDVEREDNQREDEGKGMFPDPTHGLLDQMKKSLGYYIEHGGTVLFYTQLLQTCSYCVSLLNDAGLSPMWATTPRDPEGNTVLVATHIPQGLRIPDLTARLTGLPRQGYHSARTDRCNLIHRAENGSWTVGARFGIADTAGIYSGPRLIKLIKELCGRLFLNVNKTYALCYRIIGQS